MNTAVWIILALAIALVECGPVSESKCTMRAGKRERQLPVGCEICWVAPEIKYCRSNGEFFTATCPPGTVCEAEDCVTKCVPASADTTTEPTKFPNIAPVFEEKKDI